MTHVDTAPASRPPLGIGALISTSFSILFRRFWLFLLLGLLAILGYILVAGLLFGLTITGASGVGTLLDGNASAFATTAGPGVLGIVLLIGFFLVATFTHAYQTAAGHDEFQGDHRSWSHYLRVGWRRMVPLLSVYLVSLIVVGLALYGIVALLLAVGLPAWLIALVVTAGMLGVLVILSLAVPAVVVERRWFSAFGRAWNLSRDYRGPIVGFLIAMFAVVIGLVLVIGGLLGGLAAVVGPDGIATVFVAIQALQFALQILVTALFLIGYAVLFARLRAIKEGVRSDDLVAAFD